MNLYQNGSYSAGDVPSDRLHFENIHAGGNSRSHFGNQYHNTTNNYAAATPCINVPVKPPSDPIHLDFIRACREGQGTPRLDHLRAEGANIDHRDDQQWTPLHHAASRGSVVAINYLIDHGADVHAFANSIGTPLHCAASSGSVSSVKSLLDADANKNASDPEGWVGTPLHHAAFTGSADAARCLLENKADVNAYTAWVGSSLSVAAARSHVNVVQVLLEYGVNVYGECGYFGSPAHMACAAGSMEILRMLQPEAIEEESTTCHALYHRFLDPASRTFPSALRPGAMERQLLDISVPAILAIRYGNLEAAQLCLATPFGRTSGVHYYETWHTEDDWRQPSPRSRSGVDLAIKTMDINMLRLLSDRGLIPTDDSWLKYAMNNMVAGAANSATQNGIHASACISLLLQHGVHNLCTEEMLIKAMRGQNDDTRYQVAKAIIQHGAPINAMNGDRQTALMIIAGTDHKSRIRCVELLCQSGADVDLQDKEGRTALGYARKSGGKKDFEAIELVIQHARREQRNISASSLGQRWSITKWDFIPRPFRWLQSYLHP